MAGDLPDYTKLISVNVEIPEVEVGPVNVGRYIAAPSDLPDGTRTPVLTDVKGRLIIVQYEKDRTITDGQIKPKPKGGILEKGSVTTTAAYATVATHTVTNLKTFQLAKILVTCNEDVMYQLRWAGAVISAEVYVSGGLPFTDWFPWDYKEMTGDGAKAFDIQVKYPTGGSAGTCHAEIVGEEV